MLLIFRFVIVVDIVLRHWSEGDIEEIIEGLEAVKSDRDGYPNEPQGGEVEEARSATMRGGICNAAMCQEQCEVAPGPFCQIHRKTKEKDQPARNSDNGTHSFNISGPPFYGRTGPLHLRSKRPPAYINRKASGRSLCFQY